MDFSTTMKKFFSTILLTTSISGILPGIVTAQENRQTENVLQMEQITVSANKRVEKKKDVPKSIMIIDEVEFEESDIANTEDLANQTSNLFLIKTGHHGQGSFLVLRGINPGMSGDQTVGFYVDDIFYTGFDTELFDIQQIEVLKGPQGALYGNNSEAGIINIITKKPDNETEIKAGMELGSFNTKELSVSAGSAIIEDKLFYRFSGRKLTSDGYFNNQFNGNDKIDSRDDTNMRFHLRWQPNEQLDLTVSTDKQQYRDGNGSLQPMKELLDNPHEVNMDFEGKTEVDSSTNSVRALYKGDGFKLVSISSSTQEKNIQQQDIDATAADSMKYSSDLKVQGLNEEIRITSDNKDASLQWLAGAFYFTEDKDLLVDFEINNQPTGYAAMPLINILNSRKIDLNSDGHAVFGQVSLKAAKNMEFTGGLRFDHISRKFKINLNNTFNPAMMPATSQSFDDTQSFDELLPSFSVKYNTSSDTMGYFSVAKGYKAGNYSLLADSMYNLEYKSEYTMNYEIGVKSSLLNNSLLLDVTLFLINWTDQQVEVQGYPNSYTNNAGKSKSSGLEVNITARPIQNLKFNFAFGSTNAEFEEYGYDTFDSSGNTVGHEDYSGKIIPNVPAYTYNLSATYRMLDKLFTRAELQGIGDFYFDADNTEKQEAYQLVNAQIGYEMENFDFYIRGRNLADQTYATRGFIMNNTVYGRVGDPQTIEVAINGRF